MRLSHPDFRKPACPVTLVRGAPGSGKTSYCKGVAGPEDVIIDLDECFVEVCGIHGHEAPSRFFEQALALRNAQIDALAQKHSGRAYIIVGCPTEKEVAWWRSSLGCDVKTMSVPLWEIEQRDISMSRKRLAAKWYFQEMINEWSPAVVAREVGLDGY